MPGIRLHHASLSNCIYTVENPLRGYKEPLDCSTCGRVHRVKTYHLQLDDQGCVIVSTRVLERLREIPFVIDTELRITNEVKDPPPMILSLNGRQETFRVVHHKRRRKG